MFIMELKSKLSRYSLCCSSISATIHFYENKWHWPRKRTTCWEWTSLYFEQMVRHNQAKNIR